MVYYMMLNRWISIITSICWMNNANADRRCLCSTFIYLEVTWNGSEVKYIGTKVGLIGNE